MLRCSKYSISKAVALRKMVSNSREMSSITARNPPQHHYKAYPPSQRKINREKAKEERQQLKNKCMALDEEAAKSPFEKKWVCRLNLIVERQPIVFGQAPEWYEKFENIRKQRRIDKLMPPVDLYADEVINSKEEVLMSSDKDSEEMNRLHAGTQSDITPADRSNDRKSLLRNTPGFLYLMVHSKDGWQFPSVEYSSERYPTTRRALEQLAISTYGKDMQLYFWGFPPCVHTVKKWSEEEQKKHNAFGIKNFYYRAARLIGDIYLSPLVAEEYNWMSLKEMPEYIKDEELIRLLNRVLE